MIFETKQNCLRKVDFRFHFSILAVEIIDFNENNYSKS